MSRKHPIIAVTGSSGVRRGAIKEAFDQIFRGKGILAAYVGGDSFHRYDRETMKKVIAEAEKDGCRHLSHFGPEANLFDEQERLYQTYGEGGTGRRRFYIHDSSDAAAFPGLKINPGEFTPWEDLPSGTDLLLYEGLHGWVKTDAFNLQPYVDLKIGVVPVINLEWIQKIHRDTSSRGYSEEAVVDTILRRMPDYVHYIVPQFRRSDINFQRVAVVDTSDPLIARDMPTEDETVTVIRFRRPEDFGVDFPYLLRNLHNSWMSRRNTIVVPGGKLTLAMRLVLGPIIDRMMEAKNGT
jgi:phosphoribulokinase